MRKIAERGGGRGVERARQSGLEATLSPNNIKVIEMPKGEESQVGKREVEKAEGRQD